MILLLRLVPVFYHCRSNNQTKKTNKQLISFVPYSVRVLYLSLFHIGITIQYTERRWLLNNLSRYRYQSLFDKLFSHRSPYGLLRYRFYAETLVGTHLITLNSLGYFFIASCLGNLAICLLLLKVFNFFATYSLIIQENKNFLKIKFSYN